MTLLIIIISFCIVFYINKVNTNDNLHEKFLLLLLFLSSIFWTIKSILDILKYGMMVFSPNQNIFIRDIMTGLMVVAVSLVLWVMYVLISDKKNDKANKDDKIDEKDIISNEGPSIIIDDFTKINPYYQYNNNNN